MKCVVCRGRAVARLPAKNAAFCRDHFLAHVERTVSETIRRRRMIGKGERVLVAVSGGKDSLSLADLLVRFGHDVRLLHLHLGIGGPGGYADLSRGFVERFAEARGLPCRIVAFEEAEGWGIDEVVRRKAGRAPCSACGRMKRYWMNRAALEEGARVVATGHNLDDEAATLLGNVLRWDVESLGRQGPLLPETEGFARRVKPLCLLTEKEVALYAILRGIAYVRDECPHAAGARSLFLKEILNRLEERSPGTKSAFYQEFLRRAAPRFSTEADRPDLRPCDRCGAMTTSVICAACRLRDRMATR